MKELGEIFNGVSGVIFAAKEKQVKTNVKDKSNTDKMREEIKLKSK